MYNKIVNKTIKYLVISLLIITLFIISLFAFPPSYAITLEDFTINYSSSNVNNSTYVDGISFYKLNKEYNPYGQIYTITQNTDPSYFFLYNNGNNTYNYCIAFTSGSAIGTIKLINGIGNEFTISSSSTFTYNSEYNLYYISALTQNAYSISEFYSPYTFNSLEEGFEALNNYINGPSGPSLYEGLNIPPGYIARIQVKNGTQFTLNTTMGTDNIAYQDKWVYTSQWYKFNDSSNPETAMATDGITIPWVRSGNTNILGQTNKAKYTINSTVGSYVWVLNPAYMVGQNADLYDTKLNSAIQLTNVVDVLQVRVFALKSTYTWGGIVSSTSTGSGIEYDTTTGNWLDDNGNVVEPVDYGDTNVPTTGTTLIQQFETLLSNLINRIERLLVAPVDYINQLIASANQFFLWLRGLWSWLPVPVIESITAVLIVMCTVGALKLLWR